MTIYEYVAAQNIAAYWTEAAQSEGPYLGDELFPSRQKLGLNLNWLKGSGGLPVVLKPSAFDAAVIPRPRIGFDKLETEMPFFKESKYIDEKMRQELNIALETGNANYINTILKNIFDDETELLKAARARREQMRMMVLTTGMLSISANGQDFDYDYQIPANHKVTAAVAWSDPNAPIIDEIRTWQEIAEDDTGVKPTRAVVSSKTWGYFRNNNSIRAAIWGTALLGTDVTPPPADDARISAHLRTTLGLEVVIYSKRYKDEQGVSQKYVEDDIFVMFPSGDLGATWFGTTPEQSDLMTGSAANVAIVDTGVAITAMKKEDPVNVETKVTMITLPDFPVADQIIIADISAA